MHSLEGADNRVERTLLNFFVWRGVKGGFFGVLDGRFTGDFRMAARRKWAVLPRNSGGFALCEGAARRFSTRRTWVGSRGEKIFKKGCGRAKNLKNWGARGAGRWHEGTLYRVRGAIFGSGS